MENAWARVGRYVRARRKELGVTQEQMREHGGPSAALVRSVETGVYDAQMQPGVQRAFETRLNWRYGSIESIRSGGEPSVNERPLKAEEHKTLLGIVDQQRREMARPGFEDLMELLRRWSKVKDERDDILSAASRVYGVDPEQAGEALDRALDHLGETFPLEAESSSGSIGSLGHIGPKFEATVVPPIPDDVAADDSGEPSEYTKQQDAEHGDDNKGR